MTGADTDQWGTTDGGRAESIANYTGSFADDDLRRGSSVGDLVGCKAFAREAAFDDVLFTRPTSTSISEGSTWNVGSSPSLGGGLARGSASRCDNALLRGANDGHVAHAISIDQIGHMQAAFAPNANVGVRAISAIDDHKFDP